MLYSGTALLLCSENLFLELRKVIRLRVAPWVPFLFLGFEIRHLFLGQLLSCQHSCGPGGLWIDAFLGIGGVFSVVSVLQLLHFFGFAFAAGKGESPQG